MFRTVGAGGGGGVVFRVWKRQNKQLLTISNRILIKQEQVLPIIGLIVKKKAVIKIWTNKI